MVVIAMTKEKCRGGLGVFCPTNLSLRGAKRRGNLHHLRLPRRFAPRNDRLVGQKTPNPPYTLDIP